MSLESREREIAKVRKRLAWCTLQIPSRRGGDPIEVSELGTRFLGSVLRRLGHIPNLLSCHYREVRLCFLASLLFSLVVWLHHHLGWFREEVVVANRVVCWLRHASVFRSFGMGLQSYKLVVHRIS